MTDEPLTLRQWTDVIRRARLGRTVKAVALMLATYADADGTRVFPGVARVAVDCELSYNVVKDAFGKLRTVGLIKLVRRAGRFGQADEYRLILAPDLLEHVDILSPAQLQMAVNRLRKPWGGGKGDPLGSGPRPTGGAEVDEAEPGPQPTPCPEVPVDNSEPQPTGRAEVVPVGGSTSAHGVTRGEETSAHGVGRPQPTPCPPTIQDHVTSTTSQPVNGVRTDLAVGGDTGPPQDPIPESSRCPHGLSARHRADGEPECAICRAGFANVISIRRRSA